MNGLIKYVLFQINKLNVTGNIDNLNGFFRALNTFLKGDKSSLITVFKYGGTRLLVSNILRDDAEIMTYKGFIDSLNEYLMAFMDNKELMLDIIDLMVEYGLITLNHDIRLYLFKKLYLSGYFCYVGIDDDFLDNWSYIIWDMEIISEIVSTGNLNQISNEINSIMREFYLFSREIWLLDMLD